MTTEYHAPGYSLEGSISMDNMRDGQTLIDEAQEEEYQFPYHHVAMFRKCSPRVSFGYPDGASFAQCFNDSWGINYVSTIEFILEKLEAESFCSVVDIGCGDGRLTKEVEYRFPGKRVAGIDYSLRAINLAKAMHNNGHYLCADITKAQVKDKYDVALLIEVLEHIPPDRVDKFLESIAFMLNEKGRLLLTVPHINIPISYKHYQHFSIETLTSCLSKYYVIKDVMPFERRTRWKMWIDKILTNRYFILNNPSLLSWIYKFYKNRLFHATSEMDCQRLYVCCQPIPR